MKRLLRHLLFVGLILVGLVACQPEATSSVSSPVPVAATYTLAPTATSTPAPTATATLTPTAVPTPSPDAALTRGPYLQLVTPDSIVVVWETDLPSDGVVAYGETEDCGQRVTGAVETHHAVTLTGLEPYTTYYYRVENGGAPLGETFSFRTAAAPNQTAFSFVVFGDTRTGHQYHQAVVNRILTWEPDFVIHTGDLVANGSYPGDWWWFFKIEADLMARAPLYPTLGNHERNDASYFDAFYLPGNERWYTFDYGHARFICLEIDNYQDAVDPQNEQLAWLEETLAANTQPWLFVYFHVPPPTILYDDHQGYASTEELLAALIPLFGKYEVDAAFAGHVHNYQRGIAGGVTYVVAGGGGAPLYGVGETGEYRVAAASTYHAIYVTIDGDTLTAVVVTPEGEEIDRFTLP